MASKPINICLAWNDSDSRYTRFVATTVSSIIENNKTEELSFYFICKGVTSSNKNKLSRLFNESHHHYNFIENIPKNILHFLKQNRNLKSNMDLGAYFRLFIHDIVPKEIDKILYLDSDTIVNKDLQGLWSVDLKEKLLGATLDMNYKEHDHGGKFGLKYFFNSGVLLMNLKKIRALKNYRNEIKIFIKEKRHLMVYNDQDIINYVFRDKIKTLPRKYNSYVIRQSPFDQDAVIYHYIFKTFQKSSFYLEKKYNRYNRLYFYYLDKTLWKNWRPKFSFKYGVLKTNKLLIKLKVLFGKDHLHY